MTIVLNQTSLLQSSVSCGRENDVGEVIGIATNTYDYWSGTSMASLNYAGAVALLLANIMLTKVENLSLIPIIWRVSTHMSTSTN